MSRSGYSDDCSGWSLIRWRGAVNSAIRGKRGQNFLKEMLDALDALPEKKLESSVLVADGACCAMGAVALKRKLDVSNVDPFDRDDVAGLFDIAGALAAEIAFENDDEYGWQKETPEGRFSRMRQWVLGHIKPDISHG